MKLADLQDYAEKLTEKFALPGSSSDEDQLKPGVPELLAKAGAAYGLEVETKTETHLSEHKVRPDIAVYVGKLICGYIELKAPGLGADAPKLKGKHNKEQWAKLKGLPNVLYTDGREWALYRSGERPEGQPIVRLHDDPTTAGKSAVEADDAAALGRLLRDFFGWKPNVPHTPSGLASYLAPITRFLRSEVESALEDDGSAVTLLANEWRQFFFPDADNDKFADAYAQTVTYAMLLARLSGAGTLDPAEAAKTLDKNNGLLAQSLKLLGQAEARKELSVGFEMLQRSLEALDPHDFLKSKPDLWLYFYEDFLAAYDPKLRKDYGVYYTPREVVELQVRLASELLEKRFGKKLGFADDGVVFLDPAVGTGTYPVAAIKSGIEKVEKRAGPGAVAARARQMAENMYGFEILVGPYAVAHLRLTQALEGAINSAKGEEEEDEKLAARLKIYLADALSSPDKAPPGGLDLTHRVLTQEHEAAREVKQKGDILVCLGNPPYDRQTIEEGDTITQRKGGWVRFGNVVGADQEEQGEDPPILKAFVDPATEAGQGLHLKNIYNDYIYFWRWALWRLFEQQEGGGIVTFITASSYLAGPGFVGVREVMRRTFDELWIVDLGGDNLGTRKTPNVFNIQTPVAIAIGVTHGKPDRGTPAKVHYAKVTSESQSGKLTILDGLKGIKSLSWSDCPVDWHKPFLPVGKGDYFEWPKLIDIFPYQRSGSKFGRSWPIAETRELIEQRWMTLLAKTGKERQKLFKNNQYRKIERQYRDHVTRNKLPTIASMKVGSDCPKISRYAFRSFDRQFAMEDIRFNDRMGEVLWRLQGEHQLYLISLATESLAEGQGIIATSAVPDLHHFRGSFGGKDVIPLYLDAECSQANITEGLLDLLEFALGKKPSPEDLAAYVYAVLGGQSYTSRFWNELETPGTRVPLTKDGEVFARAAKLGRKLIWLHTYAERFCDEGRGDEVPKGKATNLKGISSKPEDYPSEYEYDPEKRELRVGDGVFGPVTQEVWDFEVSGLQIVSSWLGYRMKKRAGKKSSPLDDIRPEKWTPAMSDGLLELLWVIEATLEMEPDLKAVLDEIEKGDCFRASELPEPKPEERVEPGKQNDAGGLLAGMGVVEEGDGAE
ncbi:type ISP restriction/modification enzyme [Blastomonas marina]|uniref:type ISP restriction/modification enzyme n=1 Tax=Blastomonas marina TaxID=1867408 RepID=UPI002AC8F4BE|nr:type ISP restriction/modification enzyme [Blastomonas marina]WPZ04243.1 type ISP restriction/modification enzyme [Blastomonas marina]